MNILNREEKKFVKAQVRSEAKSAGLQVPEYIGQREKGKFLSWNEYKDIQPDFDSKVKKRIRSIKSIEVGPKSKSATYWLGVADDDSDSIEVRTASSFPSPNSLASTSGQSNSNERIVS